MIPSLPQASPFPPVNRLRNPRSAGLLRRRWTDDRVAARDDTAPIASRSSRVIFFRLAATRDPRREERFLQVQRVSNTRHCELGQRQPAQHHKVRIFQLEHATRSFPPPHTYAAARPFASVIASRSARTCGQTDRTREAAREAVPRARGYLGACGTAGRSAGRVLRSVVVKLRLEIGLYLFKPRERSPRGPKSKRRSKAKSGSLFGSSF